MLISSKDAAPVKEVRLATNAGEFETTNANNELAKEEVKSKVRRVCIWLLRELPLYLQQYIDKQTGEIHLSFEQFLEDEALVSKVELLKALSEVGLGDYTVEAWDAVAAKLRLLKITAKLREADVIVRNNKLDTNSFDLEISLYLHDMYSNGLGALLKVAQSISYLEKINDQEAKDVWLEEYDSEVSKKVRAAIARSEGMIAEINGEGTRTSLSEMFRAVTSFTNKLSSQENLDVRIEKNFEPRFHQLEIELSIHKLSSYLQNFLSNAHKAYNFMPGRVDLRLEIQERSGQPHFVLTITDSAGGFPDTRLSQTTGESEFTEAQIVSGASLWGDGTDTLKQGLGVSLSAIKQQVENQYHGSFLVGNVSSRGKTGARIQLTLPVFSPKSKQEV